MIRKLLTFMLLSAMVLTLSAKKKQKADHKPTIKTTTVFMYGVSPSFNDTTVYITDVQVIDSAYFVSKHIIGGLTDYVGQLNQYFKDKGDARRTNTVFFKRTRKKAEKAYTKLRRRYNEQGTELKIIPTGEFTFKAVRPEENQE
ncbi:MAG: hypothetical protein ACI3Y5_00090 [Prevotella sp.]